ncbi:hypothetical protein D6779_02670 [Candidatus Parcubacteria bacterium]|nr:MAG: hypothetical protein D6779_02670 [Candidatus Parcubacteria bacterium]
MFMRILVFFIGFHIFFGIVLPTLYLLYRTSQGTVTQALRQIINIWKLSAWSLFFLGIALYILAFMGNVGVGGKIVLIFVALNFCLFTFFALRQVQNQWSHWKEEKKEL